MQDIKVEGLETIKAIMDRRKAEIKEEQEEAEAKQVAERQVRTRAERDLKPFSLPCLAMVNNGSSFGGGSLKNIFVTLLNILYFFSSFSFSFPYVAASGTSGGADEDCVRQGL